MKKTAPFVSKLTLENVQERFREWRKKKHWNDPIPEELWQAAVELTKEYPLGQVSKALHLGHSKFKERACASQTVEAASHTAASSFIELDFVKPPIAAECIVETENKDGSKLKICIKGQAVDVMGLAKAFWERER